MKKTNEDYLKLAKKIGHLSNETMKQIQELKLDGRTILGYVTSCKSEKWKKPANEWINELYKRRYN